MPNDSSNHILADVCSSSSTQRSPYGRCTRTKINVDCYKKKTKNWSKMIFSLDIRTQRSGRRRVILRKWLSKLFVCGISTFNLSRLSADKPRPRSRAAAAACVRLFRRKYVHGELVTVTRCCRTSWLGEPWESREQQLLFPTAPTGRMFLHMFALSAQTTRQTPETSQTLRVTWLFVKFHWAICSRLGET